MLFVAGITDNLVVFARHPDWQAAFDMDPRETIATHRRLLERAAAEHLRLPFYHAPFPATGYLIRDGDAYGYVPAPWGTR